MRTMADQLPLPIMTEVVTIYLLKLGLAWEYLRGRAEY